MSENTQCVSFDPLDRLIGRLVSEAYSYAIRLDEATRYTREDSRESAARRVTGEFKDVLRKTLCEYQSAHSLPTASLPDDLRFDGERYRAFFDAGLPITYLGEQYQDKDFLDAAIDATLGARNGRA